MSYFSIQKYKSFELLKDFFIEPSGVSGFSQANPATGTLYPASADGTIIWTVEQPSSPDYLDRLNGGFRVDDLKSDGLGAVNNGWEWMLEYQTNGTWTFSWYSVTAGTKSAAIQTQANIGSVVNVRVILDGNSLAVATSADGSAYTSRGSTTSASYQTETGISTSYTGATGSDLVTNGDFSAWTADNPDGWTRNFTEDAGNFVTETANGARLVFDGSLPSAASYLRQPNVASSNVGDYLILNINVFATASGTLRYDIPSNDVLQDVTLSGVYANRFLYSPLSQLRLANQTPSNAFDFTISEASLRLVGTLDASGDGGFTQVVQS